MNASHSPSRSRRRLVAGVVALAVGAGAGAVGGRSLRNDEAQPASTGVQVDDSTFPTVAPDRLPAAYDSPPPADPAGDAALEPPQGGAPAVGAGPLTANPGGAIDLAADPESGIEGSPPAAPAAPPESSPDDEALAAVTTAVASAVEATEVAGAAPASPLPGSLLPVPPTDRQGDGAFTDPCSSESSAEGCGSGVQAIVLGNRPLPAFAATWFGQIRQSDVYAAECSRQLPVTSIDWSNDTIFAIVVNQPVVARMTLQLNTPTVSISLIRRTRPGQTITSTVTPSADLVNAWATAYVAGARTPGIPLCVRVTKAEMDANRDGCLAELTAITWFPCNAPITAQLFPTCDTSNSEVLCTALLAALGTSQPLANPAAGPLQTTYSYDPQWNYADNQFRDGGLTQAAIRRPVQLVGIDQLNLEVRIPTFTVTLGDEVGTDGARVRLQQHQLVAASGYPPGTDCRTADPTILTTTLPVTRQIARTRYWTPDPATPASREAVVNLLMPSLAPGEAVAICVFWYLLPERSYDNPVVTSIERHIVVPPSRAATELSFLQVGRGGGLFELPHAPVRANIGTERAKWTFQVLGQTPLSRSINNRCGFTNGQLEPPIVLIPINEPGFLCRLEDSTFLFDPQDIELYTQDADQSLDQPTKGRTRINIDNRGCPASGCGQARTARINLSDGRWMDLIVRKVPLSNTPLLPGGQIIPTQSPDQWTIDPSGFISVAPTLRTPPPSATPRLDTFGVRVVQNPSDPSGSLDIIWEADRAVSIQASAAVAAPTADTQQCAQTLRDNRNLAASGTITVSGLCPNTEYGIRLILTDEAGQRSVYEWVQGGLRLDGTLGIGVQFNLVGRTAPRPLPADFLFEWQLSIGNIRGTVNVDAVLNDLQVRIGNQTLVNRSDTPSTCSRVGPNTSTASGFAGGVPLGQIQLQVSYTLSRSTGAGCTTLAEPVTFTVTYSVVWDGTGERTFTLRANDGSEVFLTLRNASAD